MAVALKDCRIGVLVVENPEYVSEGHHPRIGHVVAIGLNPVGEAMPVVEWARRYCAGNTGYDPDTFVTIYNGKIEQELMHCKKLDLFDSESHYCPAPPREYRGDF